MDSARRHRRCFTWCGGYAHDYHYIAEVRDPDEAGWLRYDANYHGGIGVPVPPPTGRCEHDGHAYYAIALAYVRVRAPA